MGRTQVALWVTLYGMVKVGELQRIAQEEDWGIVAYKIPITVVGIEFHCKTAYVTLGIGRTALAGNSGKAYKDICFLAYY